MSLSGSSPLISSFSKRSSSRDPESDRRPLRTAGWEAGGLISRRDRLTGLRPPHSPRDLLRVSSESPCSSSRNETSRSIVPCVCVLLTTLATPERSEVGLTADRGRRNKSISTY
eukprot:scaffold227859_cov29-Prasinocladus_malaysianus.AAC.1